MSEPLLPSLSHPPQLHDLILDTDISAVDGIFGYAGTAKDDDDKIVDVFVPIDIEQAMEYMGLWKKPYVN
jgi:hypothetical protein